jgi:hypothetical protein
LEVARSRECVDILTGLDGLDHDLAPLAARSQRLLAIGNAIALEDTDAVEALDATDALEAQVAAWFAADADLARRYVDQPSPALQDERAAARGAIQASVTAALEAVRAEADVILEATTDLREQAPRCDGAVLVRSTVLETCGASASEVCATARDSTALDAPYRFVESAEVLWDVQEFRAWTAPTPLQLAGGQLGGGRTRGVTRTGNLIVTLGFGPLLQPRSALPPETSQSLLAIVDTLGFGGAHPDVVYLPALTFHATLPDALDEESRYLLHFGTPEEADMIWTADAGTGADVEGIIPLAPSHLMRLASGDPLTLTAVRDTEPGEADALYAIELTSINQAAAVRTLVGYMAGELAADLERLIPPDSAGAADAQPPVAPAPPSR